MGQAPRRWPAATGARDGLCGRVQPGAAVRPGGYGLPQRRPVRGPDAPGA
ncbi:unnamed protein product, partial [Heterosigma akashiwo]